MAIPKIYTIDDLKKNKGLDRIIAKKEYLDWLNLERARDKERLNSIISKVRYRKVTKENKKRWLLSHKKENNEYMKNYMKNYYKSKKKKINENISFKEYIEKLKQI